MYKALPEHSKSAGGEYEDEPLKICGGNGTGKPLFRNDEVWFNGDEKNDLDHETFCIEPDKLDWDFCKTARKPYDLLVVACLIAAHEILDYEVSSDGGFEDWKEGIELYMKTIYTQNLDEDSMRTVLPEFLFEEQKGNGYREPYSLMDYIKSLFVVIK